MPTTPGTLALRLQRSDAPFDAQFAPRLPGDFAIDRMRVDVHDDPVRRERHHAEIAAGICGRPGGPLRRIAAVVVFERCDDSRGLLLSGTDWKERGAISGI